MKEEAKEETKENNFDFKRKFVTTEKATKEMIEILCCRIRYYQLVKPSKMVLDKRTKKNIYVPESHPDFKEVIDLIHWVADFMPSNDKSLRYRIDTIKNQLWESIGLSGIDYRENKK